MPRWRVAACLIVLALAVLSCGLLRDEPDPVVDGWPVGDPVACETLPACGELTRVAALGFDQRDPGHSPIARATLHHEGTTVDPATGDKVLHMRSGSCCWVMRFELVDGTVRAIGVGYPGVSREAIAVDFGP
jgi:hypothetical protein